MRMKTIRMALVLGALVVAASVEARQMLYCYDFDTIDAASMGLYTEGANKGTGSLVPQRKESYVNWMSGGAFGSPYALFSKANTSAVWLGDGSNALCSGLSGFTMSFWVNAPARTSAWSDFFGFRFGGTDVRFEYVDTGKPDFMTFGASFILSETDASGTLVGALPPGVWTHCCLVWNFNRAGIDLYVSGALRASITNAAWNCGHTLSQVYIGSWVRQEGKDRKTIGNTGIDDFALFDFSATPEQVQWLVHHPPALPPEGPGRDMPYRFSFDRVGNNGVNLESYGSGQGTVSHQGSGYRNYTSGAFGTARSSLLRGSGSCNSVYVSNSGEKGLGASIGTGFTFSIWVKGGKPAIDWSDFFSIGVGNQYMRGEWSSKTAPTFTGFGTGGQTGNATLTMDVWNNICYVWNDTLKRIDVYLNGTLSSTYWTYTTPPVATDVVGFLSIGSIAMGADGKWRTNSGKGCELPVDEAALFNYSFSEDEIAEMIQAPPLLPSFTATNLTCTVEADGVWQGFAAQWTVNGTAQRLTWPAWEDLRVDAAVTVAEENLTLTNDSFVTCHSLAFANGTEAPTVRLAIPNTPGAQFKPQAIVLGDGVELALPFGDSCSGAVTFGEGAKLVFDASSYAGVATVFTAVGGFVLPEGETDVLAHAMLVNGGTDLELALSGDGTQILVQPISTVPATAEWTNATADRDVTNPSNWTCRNAAGDILTDVLPTARTVVQLSGETSLSVPPDAGFVCARAAFTGNVTLVDDCDWRGLGALVIPYGVTVDVNGHVLTVGDVASDKVGWTPGTVTTGVAGGALCFDVAAEATATLGGSVRLAGALKLVKRGAGSLVLAAKGQTYTGGTEVEEGTLVYGTASFPAGPLNAYVKVMAGAMLDMNGLINGSQCIYAYDLAGTVRQYSAGNGYSNDCRCFGDITLSGDATIIGSGFFFANPTKTSGLITFNGHKLTLDISVKEGGAGYSAFGAWRDEAAGGTIEVVHGQFEAVLGYGCLRTRLVVCEGANFKIKGSFDVGGLVFESSSWISNVGTPILQVCGVYEAGPMRPPLNMRDGSTLDLGAVDGVWSVDGIAPAGLTAVKTYSEPGFVSFADGATVAVDIGTRSPTGLVVSWTTPPANLDTLNFVAPANRRYSVTFDDKGIYVRSGLYILVR